MNKLVYGLEGSGKSTKILDERCKNLKDGYLYIFSTKDYKLLYEKFKYVKEKYPLIDIQMIANKLNKGSSCYNNGEEIANVVEGVIQKTTKIVFCTSQFLKRLNHLNPSMYSNGNVRTIDEIIVDEISWDDIIIKTPENDSIEFRRDMLASYGSRFSYEENNIYITPLFKHKIKLVVLTAESVFYHFFKMVNNNNSNVIGFQGNKFRNEFEVEIISDDIENNFKKYNVIELSYNNCMNAMLLECINNINKKDNLKQYFCVDDVFSNKIEGLTNHMLLKGTNRIDVTKNYLAVFNEFPPYYYNNIVLFFNFVTKEETVISRTEIESIVLKDQVLQTVGRVLGWRNYRHSEGVVRTFKIFVSKRFKDKISNVELPYELKQNEIDLLDIFTKTEVTEMIRMIEEKQKTERKNPEDYQEAKNKRTAKMIYDVCLVKTGDKNDRITKQEFQNRFGIKLSKLRYIVEEIDGVWMNKNNLFVRGLKIKEGK